MVDTINELINKVKSGKIENKNRLFLELLGKKENRAELRDLYEWVKSIGDSKESMVFGLGSYRDNNYLFSGRRVAKFEKVSFKRFFEDASSIFKGLSEEDIKFMYDEKIKLPERATFGSAGYDFVTPVQIYLKPGETVKIPTGIRCRMHTDWVLGLLPRSGYGFKYRVQLDNTVGVIDSDYYYSSNEGHIFVKITNDGKEGKDFEVCSGDAFCQGIFQIYGLTVDDDIKGIRNGGFGSTSSK